MDRTKRSNLDNLIPLWERKLAHPMHEPPLESLIRPDMNFPAPPTGENIFGQASTSAQDFFSALIVSQGRLKSPL